ncbi:MAG: hypothetical protein AB8G99_25225 [Planctomycetaceae bacterium]
MPRDRQVLGQCTSCDADGMTCTYNFFEGKGLTIHSWEHKCLGCGLRDTTAYRSDDEDDPPENPTECPYCHRAPDLDAME